MGNGVSRKIAFEIFWPLVKTRNGAYQRLKLLSAPLSLDENTEQYTEQYLPKNAISAHSLRAYIFSNIRSVLLCYGQVWFIMSAGPAELGMCVWGGGHDKGGSVNPITAKWPDNAHHINISPPPRILRSSTGSNIVWVTLSRVVPLLSTSL